MLSIESRVYALIFYSNLDSIYSWIVRQPAYRLEKANGGRVIFGKKKRKVFIYLHVLFFYLKKQIRYIC